MKISVVKHPNINKGEETRIYCPLAKREFETQLKEIFDLEHYKRGRRKKNSVYFDIGSNIGMTCLYFKDWAKHIYALEPSKENFKALLRNTEDFKNISCHNYAVFPTNGRNNFYKTDEDSTAQTFFPEIKPIYDEVVDCITLDRFFEKEKIDHIDVMKIDVENSEYIILPDKSFSKVADKIDFIIGESHYCHFGFPEILPQVLEKNGFKTEFLQLDHPNFIRTFSYKDQDTGEVEEYRQKFNTMFIAYKP